MFLAFAFAYFFSALLRAVTATLAPAFSAELGLGAADLGLLAGAYFLGFSVMQLPLGRWLDRIGPRRVLLACLSVAVLACGAFALAEGFAALWLAETPARAWDRAGRDSRRPLAQDRAAFLARWQTRMAAWSQADMLLAFGHSSRDLASALLD